MQRVDPSLSGTFQLSPLFTRTIEPNNNRLTYLSASFNYVYCQDNDYTSVKGVPLEQDRSFRFVISVGLLTYAENSGAGAPYDTKVSISTITIMTMIMIINEWRCKFSYETAFAVFTR